MRRQLAHLWDASRCINCGACLVACAATNHPELAHAGDELPRGFPANIARTLDERDGRARLTMVQCQQCSAAPCLVRCPTRAITRDADGLMRTDEAKCNRCMLCIVTCPYGARWMRPNGAAPASCMGPGCRGLVAAGQAPACVQACPGLARAFGDVADKATPIAQRIAAADVQRRRIDRGTRPNLYVMDAA